MAVKTVALVESRQAQSLISYGPQDFGAAAGNWGVHCSRLRGGLSDGVDLVELNNGALSFTVVPTRGMGLWQAALPGWPIGWQSPVRGPVHPAFVDLGEPSGLGWLDGFDELLVRCGLESNGAPEFDETTGRLKYPLHGRIANRPAHDVTLSFDSERQELSVRGVVEETRFLFLHVRLVTTYTTKLGSSTIQICDEVENLSDKPAEIQLLYHINFGAPLLDAGARVVGPFKTVVPRNAHAAQGIGTWDHYEAAQANFQEQVYLTQLHADAAGNTRTLLTNAGGTQGVSVLFNTQQLPCFTLWKNTAGDADGCVTGLEPGTNYPNPRSFEGKHGRLVALPPGGRTRFDLALEMHATADEVSMAQQAALALSGNAKPQLHAQPQPEWCAP